MVQCFAVLPHSKEVAGLIPSNVECRVCLPVFPPRVHTHAREADWEL